MQGSRSDSKFDIPDQVASISSSSVSPGQVYEALADLRRHAVWGGTMHRKRDHGITSIDAPAGAAQVGTEFRSTGSDPAGTFSDRSVVTEATRPSVFEFVTEGHLTPKKKDRPEGDTTITFRYQITPNGGGCTVSYRGHVTRWTNPPKILTSRLVRPLAKA